MQLDDFMFSRVQANRSCEMERSAPLLSHSIKAIRWLQLHDDSITEAKLTKIKSWIDALRSYVMTFEECSYEPIFSPLLDAVAAFYENETEEVDVSRLDDTLHCLERAQEALDELPCAQRSEWARNAPKFTFKTSFASSTDVATSDALSHKYGV
jgi:hypothetical protein